MSGSQTSAGSPARTLRGLSKKPSAFRRIAICWRVASSAPRLLRDTEAPIIEIAFQTGWSSLGSFGRVFRDVTGESPSELRAREQASAHQLDQVPHCFVSAAYRPDLKIAVSEKRRREAGDRTDPEETEVPK